MPRDRGAPSLQRREWLAGTAAGLGGLAGWPVASVAASAEPVPVAAFLERPLMGGARLSPDGHRVAMRVAAAGARYRLAVLDLETRQSRIVAGIDDADVDDFC